MTEKKKKLNLNSVIANVVVLLVICCTGVTIFLWKKNKSEDIVAGSDAQLSEANTSSDNDSNQDKDNITFVDPGKVIINNPGNPDTETEEEIALEDLETLHEPIDSLTLVEKHEYLDALTAAAEPVAGQFGVSLNVMLAIALYNSDWGENDFADFNNPVGILAESGDDYIIFTTYIGDDNNQMVATERKIKTYENVEDCFIDLAVLMKKHGADKRFDDLEDLLALSDTEYVQVEVESAYEKLLYELSSRVDDDFNLDDVENYELIERGEDD